MRFFLKIWKDPVWSKVIAVAISGVCLFIWQKFSINTFNIAYPIPVWVLLILFLLLLSCFFKIFFSRKKFFEYKANNSKIDKPSLKIEEQVISKYNSFYEAIEKHINGSNKLKNLKIYAVTSKSFAFTLIEKNRGLIIDKVEIIIPSDNAINFFYKNSGNKVYDNLKTAINNIIQEKNSTKDIWKNAERLGRIQLDIHEIDSFPYSYFSIIDNKKILFAPFIFKKNEGLYGMNTDSIYFSEIPELIEFFSDLFDNYKKCFL